MRAALDEIVLDGARRMLADRRPSAQDHRLLLPSRSPIRQPADGESFRLTSTEGPGRATHHYHLDR